MRYIKKQLELIKEKKSLVEDFSKLHGDSIENLKMESLRISANTVDKKIYDAFHEEKNWKQLISEIKSLEIPVWFKDHFQLKQASDTEKTQKKPDNKDATLQINDNKHEKRLKKPGNDEWNFAFDVGYFYSLIPYYVYPGESSEIDAQAYSVVDKQLTTQPDIVDSQTIPFTFETPKADAITGNFDNYNDKDLVLQQTNNTISLDEIILNSVKSYKNLYSEETTYFTKSQSCNILNIEGKEQIITGKLNSTQLGFDAYYFENGNKIEFCSSELFDHKIGCSKVMAFDISVSDILDNGTIEIIAIISKSDDPQTGIKFNVQTNIIKAVLDVNNKSFNFISNQIIASFNTGMFLMTNMVQQIYRINDFIYLNYFSNVNTLSIMAMQWDPDENIYKAIWNDDYSISAPGYFSAYQAPLFYRKGDVFYYVHVFQNANSNYPYYVEIYSLQDDGSLTKTKTIQFSNTSLNPYANYWGGLYIQDSLYLLQTSASSGGSSLDPISIFYCVDEVNNKVNQLSLIPRSHEATGMPIMVLTNYNIKALAPKISSLTDSIQAIVILDSPPISSLIDYGDGKNYPSLNYQFEQKETSKNNVETKTDRSKSDSLNAGIKFFGIDIGSSLSKKITESSDQSHVSQFQQVQNTQITSEVQDMTVFLGITFDIYEYPITLEGKPSGEFLFIVPTSTPHIIVNTGQLMFRKTSHQVGNLLSYPTEPPSDDDVNQMLYTSEFNINADEESILTLSYSDLKTESETTTTTTTVDKSLSLKIEFPIIKDVAGSIGGKLEGSYTDTEINISSFTIENSFQLKIQIQKLQEHDANKYFSIEPYFYIDNSNVIRCKYRVDVPAGGKTDPSYWGYYYKLPDFAMVMPFHYDAFKDDSKYYLSFDIQTKPSKLVKDLKELEISAKIHNWSLVSGTNVEVAFYYAKSFKVPPDESDLIEIGRQTISLIEPRGSQVVSCKWENPYLIQPINAVPIYVKIDPDNKIKEMSKSNNIAQMNYPIESLQAELEIEKYLK